MLDVVKAYKKNKGIWGIEGYDFPKFNAHLDKIPNLKISPNGEKKTFID